MRHLLAKLLALAFVTLTMHTAVFSADMKTAPPPLAVGVVFDGDGRLWRVRLVEGYLSVDTSDDQGRSYGSSTRVTQVPEPVAAHGDLRPEIALGRNGKVYIAWTSPLPQPYAGNIRFARSFDGGKSYQAPITVNDNHDAITHRFQTMHVASDGRITLVWIDKRDGEVAKRSRQLYLGAALYYAVSSDGGASFGANARFTSHACECCRIGLAEDGEGLPIAFWRHVFADGTRDHALARVGTLTSEKEPLRATAERWKINACPHHGPDLAISADGTRHGAWFNMAAGEPGLFYGTWNRGGRALTPVMHFGEPNAGHPSLLVLGARVLLAWKEFDGEKTSVKLLESADGGLRWPNPRTLAVAVDASDHPKLLAYGDQAYLSWSASKEGHRMISIASGKGTHQ